LEPKNTTTINKSLDSANHKSIWGQACSGLDLRDTLVACGTWLAEHTDAINALNVFPVPDGDTGTNMTRTMEAAIAEIKDLKEGTAEHISKRLSFGALMGARGNSGVILSQIIRGLADGLAGKENVTALDFAHCLVKAKEMAYKAVMKPIEGTMLTVVRESAEAAIEAAKLHNNFLYVLTETVSAAKASVERTPTLLATLREAGVVDAGGHGFFVLLEGALRHLRGESLVKTELSEIEKARPTFTVAADGDEEHQLDEYGYCTNFLLNTAQPIAFEEIRDRIAAMGTSAVIVGDENMVKVHLHTEDPGSLITYATSLGSLSQIKLDNMQLQHEEAFLNKGSSNGVAAGKGLVTEGFEPAQGSISIVSVVPGNGLVEVFRSLGTNAVVHGGQTMNPSTQELLKAVDSLPSNEVVILPNNKNIIMVANQVKNLTKKHVMVVPSATLPQGITALSRFNFEETLESNAANMTASLKDVQTGEVTRAVRTATINGIPVETGQWIGLLNDELSVSAPSKEEVIWQLLEQMGAANSELLTFYYGKDVTEVEAETLLAQVKARFASQEVQSVPGGQPHYHYIISAE